VRNLCGSVALIGVLGTAGCSTQAKWTYPLDSHDLFVSQAPAVNLTVAVLPFREDRPLKNVSATRYMWLIPVVPLGWVTYERPEAARVLNSIEKYEFQLDDDLGKAAARSFQQSKLFHRVYFTLGGETREADLILRGTARHTTYDGKIWSYGLSVFVYPLWWIGVPFGSSTNKLALELRLEDENENSLWTYDYSGDDWLIQGYYYNYGDDVTNMAGLMEQAMNAAVNDLAPKLSGIARSVRSESPAPTRGPEPAPSRTDPSPR